MPETQARLGYGALLQRNGVTVLEVRDIEGPDMSGDDVKVTNQQSPERTHEYIAGLKEPGNINFSGNLVLGNATHQQLLTDYKSGETNTWQIVAPDATAEENRSVVSFSAYVKDCGYRFPVESEMNYSVSLKVAGAVTISTTNASDLTNIVLSVGDLTPAVDSGIYEYVATVSNATESITVTPTGASADSIYVDGELVESGEASDGIDLDVGVNEIIIRVVEDDKTPRLYKLYVARAEAE